MSVELSEGARVKKLIYTENAGQGGGQNEAKEGGTERQCNAVLFLNLNGEISSYSDELVKLPLDEHRSW